MIDTDIKQNISIKSYEIMNDKNKHLFFLYFTGYKLIPV